MVSRIAVIVAVLWCIGFAYSLATESPAPAGAATRKRHTNWTSSQFTRHSITRIALVPVVTYDRDADAEASIAATLLRAFATKGYDWVTTTTAMEALNAEPADSPVSARGVCDTVLATKEARVDSLVAPALCGLLRCDAILSVRVEGEKTGRPWMKGALVARDGTLLWTGDRTGDDFVGRTKDPASRTAAEHAAAQTWIGGLHPILDRWAMDFPKAVRAR